MDDHKNAPWTAVSRERLARMVIHEGVTLKAAAARFSVSARTAAKWMGRYRQLGVAGLADRSSRPHHSPRQTDSFLVEKVVALHRLHHNGWRIARDLGLSPATVSRILRGARLSRSSSSSTRRWCSACRNRSIPRIWSAVMPSRRAVAICSRVKPKSLSARMRCSCESWLAE